MSAAADGRRGDYVALIPGAYGFTSAYADAEFNGLARKVLRLSVALFAATVAVNALSVAVHLVVILALPGGAGRYAVFLGVSSALSLLAVAISGLIAWDYGRGPGPHTYIFPSRKTPGGPARQASEALRPELRPLRTLEPPLEWSDARPAPEHPGDLPQPALDEAWRELGLPLP